MTGKISDDADRVVDGTEKIAAAASSTNFGILVTSIATFLASQTKTLTNKTISAASNTIQNLVTSNFASGTIDTDSALAANSDSALATQKATKTFVNQRTFGQCRFSLSAGNVILLPSNGNLLTVNGVACTVPAVGVTGTISGLSASTFYYVYATASSGAVNALEFSTTAPTADTNGVQIKTGAATRTLIGAVYTSSDSPPQFKDTNGDLTVLSYYNRRRKFSYTTFSTTRTSGSDTLAEINSEIRCRFIAWNSGTSDGTLGAQPQGSATPNQIVSCIAIDSTSAAFSTDCISYVAAINVYLPAAQRALSTGLTENALHFATMLGRASGGAFTATWDSRTSLQFTIEG